MLKPFEWAVITVEEAKLLKYYIEMSTATKTVLVNYAKMEKVGILIMYEKLKDFIESAAHYDKLKYFDPDWK